MLPTLTRDDKPPPYAKYSVSTTQWLLDKRPVICKAGTVDVKGVFLPGAKKENTDSGLVHQCACVHVHCTTYTDKACHFSSRYRYAYKLNTNPTTAARVIRIAAGAKKNPCTTLKTELITKDTRGR